MTTGGANSVAGFFVPAAGEGGLAFNVAIKR